jgi:epoxyqueuosine reductase
VASGISKWAYRQISQEVCPWNKKFALPLREEAFLPRAVIAGKDARTLARELLEMSQDEFSKAFKGSPMKRAKLRGLKRNAAVVLGNVGNSDDANILTRTSDDPEPLPREHAAWALTRLSDDASRRH